MTLAVWWEGWKEPGKREVWGLLEKGKKKCCVGGNEINASHKVFVGSHLFFLISFTSYLDVYLRLVHPLFFLFGV